MEYIIYRFQFETAVHFGDGNLGSSEKTFCADSLFSALCNEAVNFGDNVTSLVDAVKQKKLCFSDLFPYINDELYIPKPLCYIKPEKEYKRLKYIPLSKLSNINDINAKKELEILNSLGSSDVRTMTSMRSLEKLETGDALPYSVGIFKFNPNNGLYCIVGFNDNNIKSEFEKLLNALSYSGIGGKKSAGFGRFKFKSEPIPDNLKQRLTISKPPFMALSICMCNSDELENSIKNAKYSLQKRTGFIFSNTYAPENRRKKDFYAFSAGSCFENKFNGDVFDVGLGGKHPVYRYSATMFMEV